jgi:hypothetical protein
VVVGPGDPAGTAVAAEDSGAEGGTLDDAATTVPVDVVGEVFDVDSVSSAHPVARARHNTVAAPIVCVARTFLAHTGVAVALEASADGIESIDKAAVLADDDGFGGVIRERLALAASPDAASFRHRIVDQSPSGAGARRIERAAIDPRVNARQRPCAALIPALPPVRLEPET